MNCRYFHKGYVELLDVDAGTATSTRGKLAGHLESCGTCTEFYDEITRTLALLRPSRQVVASPRFKEQVMNRILEREEIGHREPQIRESARMKIWQPALAAGIAALLLFGGLLFLRFVSARNGSGEMSAFSLIRQAYAAEESLFAGRGIVSIVNEIVVKPISNPVLARARWFPIISLDASGKLRFHQLALPAEPGEQYAVDDRAWYDPETGRYARLLSVGGKPIFANSYDGNSVYVLEPDASGVSRVVGKPATEDFSPPESPAEFLGIAAGLPSSLDEKDRSLFEDAGEVTLHDGSAARAVKAGFPRGGPEGLPNTYSLFKIRKNDNTIAEMEWIAAGESMLIIRRVRTGTVQGQGVSWNLVGIGSQAGKVEERPKVRVTPDMVVSDVSVRRMVEKADFETYIFASDPAWAGKREITDILDIVSPPHRMFAVSYRAEDGRHVVVVQSHTYNRMLGPMTKLPTAKLVYTSPAGVKVWSGPRDKWLAGILLQSARAAIKDAPAKERTGCLLETPAGTFPCLAINGPVSDDELYALIDSLVPAREYLGK